MATNAWIRRIRGVVGVATTWGAGWFAAGGAWFGLRLWGTASLASILGLAMQVGAAGLLAGAGFAVALTVMGRRRTMGQLTYPRVALAGALGGALVWAPFALVGAGALAGTIVSMAGLLGAVSSVVTLGIARHGPAADALLAKPARAALESEIGIT